MGIALVVATSIALVATTIGRDEPRTAVRETPASGVVNNTPTEMRAAFGAFAGPLTTIANTPTELRGGLVEATDTEHLVGRRGVTPRVGKPDVAPPSQSGSSVGSDIPARYHPQP
jgi:hypothetical protein